MKHSPDEFEISFDIEAPVIEETEMPESFEEATKAEVSDFMKKFRAQSEEEKRLKEQNVSTDYWFAVYFANQAQRDRFLMALDLLDIMADQYIDGEAFAKAAGVDLPKETITVPKAFRKPAGIDDMILNI